jgi:hypothetical protein
MDRENTVRKNNRRTSVFKIQKSLDGNKMLIYNERRDMQYEGILTEEIDELLAGEMKIYFNGFLKPNGEIGLINRAPEQDW